MNLRAYYSAAHVACAVVMFWGLTKMGLDGAAFMSLANLGMVLVLSWNIAVIVNYIMAPEPVKLIIIVDDESKAPTHTEGEKPT